MKNNPIDQITIALDSLNKANQEHKNLITQQVQDIQTKLDKKFIPITLEQDILKTAQEAVQDSIKKVLTDYNSPLTKLTTEVINNHNQQLKQIINEAFSQVINTINFKNSIVTAFSHKVARSIISNNEGLFDKVHNELKNDAVFKAKMTQAVANVVEECLKR